MSGVATIAALVAIASTLVGAIFAFASLWGAMREKQSNQDKKQKEQHDAQSCTDARVTALEAMMARLDEAIKGLKEELKSSNAKLDRILDRQASGRDV